jgi:plasmid stabilization system protein ParE
VATVVFSRTAIRHLELTFAFLRERDPDAAAGAASAIRSATEMLAAHPLVGRRVHRNLRELVISYGRTGYVALYRFLPVADEVRVLAIRHQREIGYRS